MLTFKQFLIREKFFCGVDGQFGYGEVYKNPTKYEVMQCARGGDQIGAFATNKDLFIWSRDEAEHAAVKPKVIRSNEDFIPLYLYYNKATNGVEASIATFSWFASGKDRWSDEDEREMIEGLEKHPAFKIFSSIKKF
jgi:hypothetical protein